MTNSLVKGLFTAVALLVMVSLQTYIIMKVMLENNSPGPRKFMGGK